MDIMRVPEVLEVLGVPGLQEVLRVPSVLSMHGVPGLMGVLGELSAGTGYHLYTMLYDDSNTIFVKSEYLAKVFTDIIFISGSIYHK